MDNTITTGLKRGLSRCKNLWLFSFFFTFVVLHSQLYCYVASLSLLSIRLLFPASNNSVSLLICRATVFKFNMSNKIFACLLLTLLFYTFCFLSFTSLVSLAGFYTKNEPLEALKDTGALYNLWCTISFSASRKRTLTLGPEGVRLCTYGRFDCIDHDIGSISVNRAVWVGQGQNVGCPMAYRWLISLKKNPKQ